MVIDGDWSFVEKKFKVRNGTSKVQILVQGVDTESEQELYIDEFLLRASHIDVYSEMKKGEETFLFYNNLWIRKPAD